MRCLNTNDVRLACEEIEQDPASFSFSQPVKSDGEKEKDTSFTKFEVMKLQSKGLFAYLHSRKVNVNIAKQFLQEAHYSFRNDDDSYLYALAYSNDLGGYELRGAPYSGNPKGYKGGTCPKGITTHFIKYNAPVVVFEGFMDMLSFATLCGGVKHNYVVLNSVVNKEAALEVLKTSQNQVYLCLDNDRGGVIPRHGSCSSYRWLRTSGRGSLRRRTLTTTFYGFEIVAGFFLLVSSSVWPCRSSAS